MLIVSTTPNQIGSKPAAVITGKMMGVVIKIMAAGGKKQPNTSNKTLISANRIQRLTSISAIASAMLWVTRLEDMA